MNCGDRIIIVGGGPAGASLAIRLARLGFKVDLFEERRFPRHKLCGEFISPECVRHFAQLGLLDRIEGAGGARLRRTVFYSSRGRSFVVPSAWFGGHAWGLSRARLDDLLLDQARRAGAEIHAETRVTGLIEEDGRIVGVIARNAVGTQQLSAELIVDATGRRRALARKFERSRTNASRRAPSLVAFKTHLRGARPSNETCEIYLYRCGYGGLSPVEDGLCNLCFIVAAHEVRAHGGDADALLRRIVCTNARAAKTLRDARAVLPWSSASIERFGRMKLAPAPNLLAVGDAASFIDPFTGSGLLLALESGETLAHAIETNWRSAGAWDELKGDYARRYEARFGRRLHWCAAFRRFAFAPQRAIEAGAMLLAASERALRHVAQATRARRAR
ncbi:MAG: hypothetical protein C4334_11155 [Pyrinomonas sp.]|uniref:NAD(P)/FAD-dependent oxidoreductase n=1 Tax=Pyrinomonas sp. TaxID=2080306 RepID=UPI00332102C5